MAAKVGPDEYRCPGPCGQVKPRSEFYDSKCKRNGVSHYCKTCHRDRMREVRGKTAQAA